MESDRRTVGSIVAVVLPTPTCPNRLLKTFNAQKVIKRNSRKHDAKKSTEPAQPKRRPSSQWQKHDQSR